MIQSVHLGFAGRTESIEGRVPLGRQSGGGPVQRAKEELHRTTGVRTRGIQWRMSREPHTQDAGQLLVGLGARFPLDRYLVIKN